MQTKRFTFLKMTGLVKKQQQTLDRNQTTFVPGSYTPDTLL